MTRKLSIFTRIGGKYNVREKIVKYFPSEYKRYVEPFLGGGQVFLELKKDDDIEYILNDKNKDIYDIWSDLKKIDAEKVRSFDWRGSKKTYDRLLNLKTNDPNERLYRNLYLSFYSFSGTRKSYVEKNTMRGQSFLKNINLIQEILKNVKIFNKDYKQIIEKYDDIDTLFYLDPPYTRKGALYEGQSIDPYELAEICKGIKGKFVLSYDISKEVKDAFKEFNFYKIKVPYVAGFENRDQYEYIITNFAKTRGGRIETLLFELPSNDFKKEVEKVLHNDCCCLVNLERFLNLRHENKHF